MRLKLASLAFALALIAFPASAAHAQSSCSLIVHVDGFRNDKGDAGATLFKDSNGWPEDNDKSYKHGPFPIVGKKATVKFDDMAPGIYAFAVIHDENSNHKMDKNMLGIPKEGFGFANNPHVTFITPSFNAASIHVTCPVTEISVHMQYK